MISEDFIPLNLGNGYITLFLVMMLEPIAKLLGIPSGYEKNHSRP